MSDIIATSPTMEGILAEIRSRHMGSAIRLDLIRNYRNESTYDVYVNKTKLPDVRVTKKVTDRFKFERTT